MNLNSKASSSRFTQKLPQFLKQRLLTLQLKKFAPKFSFSIEYKNFTIKTADSYQELIEIIKLRNKVFWNERLFIDQHYSKEIEKFDFTADHIILIEKKSGLIIGSYRLISDQFCKNFYSLSQYQMQEFTEAPGSKLELGRAVIHPQYRNGVTLSMVWKGIAKYAQISQADYFFGCTSIDSTDSQVAKFLWNHFKEQSLWSDEYHIRALSEFKMKDSPHQLVDHSDQASQLVPTLLKSYIKAGAKIYGEPAIDRKMKTVDFITILKMSEISPQHQRRYFD